MSRPQFTKNYLGRRFGALGLVKILEQQIDLGHPSAEGAADLTLVTRELSRLAVPRTNPRAVLARIKNLRRILSALSWSELEDELAAILDAVIRRYTYTHPRRSVPGRIRSKLRPASTLPLRS